MPKLVKVFWQESHDIVLKCLRLLGAHQQIFDDANYKIDQTTWFENPENLVDLGAVNVNSWEVIPISGTPFENELRNRIGNSFFYEQISWECPFPLPIESFGSILENNDEDGLLFTFFKLACKSALIGYQRLIGQKFSTRDLFTNGKLLNYKSRKSLFSQLTICQRIFSTDGETNLCQKSQNLLG